MRRMPKVPLRVFGRPCLRHAGAHELDLVRLGDAAVHRYASFRSDTFSIRTSLIASPMK
jgi:hypothetical protein